ncbi:MAG: hypothetical protein HOQ07_03755 [Sinomonas sp.]|nr:hypothetical protein [Sinomonas sp.]
MTSNADPEDSDVERAEEQGGYGSPTPEQEMGPRTGQGAAGREGEGETREDKGENREGLSDQRIDPTEKDGMAGEPTD